jgi:hypothetical protein
VDRGLDRIRASSPKVATEIVALSKAARADARDVYLWWREDTRGRPYHGAGLARLPEHVRAKIEAHVGSVAPFLAKSHRSRNPV